MAPRLAVTASRRRGWRAAGIVAGLVVAAAVALLVSGSGHRARQAPPPVPAAPDPGLPAPAGEAYGVNVNRLFNDMTHSPAQISAQLAALRATGATLARSDSLWEAGEPTPPVDGHHHYDWGFDDRIAGSLAGHGLTWLPILDYSAPWAQSIPGQDHSPPSSDADYAAYAAAFAARYGADGTFWREHPELTAAPVRTIEIWNEPDNGEFWTPSPDAGRYAALYLAARAAIDVVDPGVRVIVGGLTNPAGFLAAMVAAQPALPGHIDGVAIHPYGPPDVLVAKVKRARAALAALGMDAVPLYVTEFGWTTDPPGALDYAPARLRPGYIVRAFADLGHLACGVAADLLYTWVTPERDPRNSQDWFGIASPENAGTATPGITALTAGMRAAAGSSSRTPCRP